MQVKDYYKVLDVPEHISKQELKISYRKLAKKYHPDANLGNLEAEQKFKDITEAYDVLKDDEKRKKYDQLKRLSFTSDNEDWFSFGANGNGYNPTSVAFDSTAQEQGANFSFTDILKEIFGFDDLAKNAGAAKTQQALQKTVSVEVEISLREAVIGTSKLLKLSIPALCKQCKGAGYIRTGKCDECKGKGKTKTSRKIRIKVPAGVENMHKLRLKKIVPQLDPGLPPSDLDVVVKIAPHEFFEKRGLDIYCEIPVNEHILRDGAQISVYTISKNKVSVKIPAGTQKGTVFRIPQLGIRKNGHIGDQLVKFI